MQWAFNKTFLRSYSLPGFVYHSSHGNEFEKGEALSRKGKTEHMQSESRVGHYW